MLMLNTSIFLFSAIFQALMNRIQDWFGTSSISNQTLSNEKRFSINVSCPLSDRRVILIKEFFLDLF
jgi:hypothetical protein